MHSHRSFKQFIAAFVLLFATATTTMAQKPSGNVNDLVNKTWYILAMKCPGEVQFGGGGSKDKYMQYYFSLELKPANPNNLNYGTYTRISTDMDTNPGQEGKYTLRTDESGTQVMQLTYGSKNYTTVYNFKVLDENHLTLSRLSDSNEDKCRVHYAIAP